MSTTLTQSAAAAFADRPKVGGIGLHADVNTGDQGTYLVHDLGAPQNVIHLRFLLNPWGLSGGQCVVIAGLDDLGAEVARLSYHAANKTLSVWTPGGVVLNAQLDGVITWQCMEVAFDAVAGQATLWVNGVVADQSSGDLSATTVQSVLFGVIQKHTDLAGDLFLDEWVIADANIGPVTVAPRSPYADDPARWLVVYNTSDPDAASWAEAYRQARSVPFANLAGLALPTSETIDAAQYAGLVSVIDGYLADNALAGQVMGILLGYRVPGYVDFTGGGTLEAVSALLQTSSTTAGTLSNPNAAPVSYDPLTFDNLAGVRMTARLDAQDLTAATAQLARANTLIADGLSGGDSTIYFDPFVGAEPTYQQAFADMLAWATGLGGMRTRLPITLSGDPAGNAEAAFASVSNDGVFWGWSSTLPDPAIFAAPAGRRAVSVQLYLEGASATTLRSAMPGNWADAPIDAGYAAAVASSRANPVSAIPDAGAFFNALRAGWTLGEAWHAAQPALRSGFYLVGDPLMTVAMPMQGFEVFGPLMSLEDLDPATPDFVLAEDVTSLDISDALPSAGFVSHYLVRRSDSLGRIESSTQTVQTINVLGSAQPAATLPAWPDVNDWPVPAESGQVRLTAYWERPIGACNVQAIELLSQGDGQAFVVATTPTWKPFDRFVTVTLPIAPVKMRYRWRFTSTGGAVQFTAWSAWVEPAPVPTISLEPIGATP